MDINNLESTIKKSDRLGLVFGGGASLGAYQIGVYEVIKELGLEEQIVALAGTSVGSLNLAPLQEEGGFKSLKNFWTNIKCGEALDGIAKTLCSVSPYKRDSLHTQQAKKEIENSNCDLEDLNFGLNQFSEKNNSSQNLEIPKLQCGSGYSTHKELINSINNFKKFLPKLLTQNTKPIYITRVRVDKSELEYVTQINKSNSSDIFTFENIEEIINNIIASSSAAPLFDCYAINGVKYRDGGQNFGNNLPYQILDREEKLDKIIAVSLVSDDILPKGDKYINIQTPSPYKDNKLFRLSFKSEFTNKLIEVGKKDALKALKLEK